MKIQQYPPETGNNLKRDGSIHDRRHECHMRTYFICHTTQHCRQIKRIFFMNTKFIIRTFTSHISFPLVDRKRAFSRIFMIYANFSRCSVHIVFFLSSVRRASERLLKAVGCEVALKSTCPRIILANSILRWFSFNSTRQ